MSSLLSTCQCHLLLMTHNSLCCRTTWPPSMCRLTAATSRPPNFSSTGSVKWTPGLWSVTVRGHLQFYDTFSYMTHVYKDMEMSPHVVVHWSTCYIVVMHVYNISMATYTAVPRICLLVLATVKVTFYRQVLLFFLVINFLIFLRTSQNVCLLEMK